MGDYWHVDNSVITYTCCALQQRPSRHSSRCQLLYSSTCWEWTKLWWEWWFSQWRRPLHHCQSTCNLARDTHQTHTSARLRLQKVQLLGSPLPKSGNLYVNTAIIDPQKSIIRQNSSVNCSQKLWSNKVGTLRWFGKQRKSASQF